MHSSAKSPGLPGESWDQRLTHIQMGGSEAGAATNTHGHKTHIYTEAQTSMHLVPPSPVCLIVLSVRMGFEL